MISKAEKITYKDTPAESMLEDLAYRLWELEYQRFEMCDEISLEQLQELDKRRIYLRNKRPESLEKYENTRLEVDQCVEFFESCLNQDIAAVFVGNLNELKQRLEFYKGKLDNFGIIFPEKYNKILLWDKWIDWSLLVDNLFAADQKPSIDNLYDANLEVVSLSINPGLPAFQNLTAEIASYESWLYKYTSFSSARRAYAKSNLEVKNYLKIALEKPKFTTCQLQDLLDGAKDLKTSCEEEINLIHQDLNKLQE